MKKIIGVLISLLVMLQAINAQQNSQWRGPKGNGTYPETGLLKQWKADKLDTVWQFHELGEGHSSAAVTSDKVYTTGTLQGKGYVFAFDHNGNLLWKVEYGDEWTESYPGSRCTPVIYDSKLYVYSAFGRLVCMSASDGKIIWSADMMKDYGGRNIQWGVTESVLVFDNKVICTPGGTEHNVIALDSNTGKLIWTTKTTGEKSAYCTPLLIELPTRKLVVTMMEGSIVGIDGTTGQYLWRSEQTNRWSVHANTPVYHDGQIYCVSGYGKGGVMLQLATDGASVKEMWRNQSLDNRIGGVVLVDGYIYGAGDNNKNWECLDWKTGEVKYSSNALGIGCVIFADGMLYCYAEKGDLGLVKATPTGFEVISKMKVNFGSAQHWAHPVIGNGRLYVRHGKSLVAFSVK